MFKRASYGKNRSLAQPQPPRKLADGHVYAGFRDGLEHCERLYEGRYEIGLFWHFVQYSERTIIFLSRIITFVKLIYKGFYFFLDNKDKFGTMLAIFGSIY
jgi:hypothetical protein